MVKNFIFDLDGTLIHSSPGIIHSFNHAYKKIFECEPDFSIENQIGPPVSKMLLNNKPETTEHQLKEFVTAFQTEYDTTGYKNTLTYNKVEETLKWLIQNGCTLFIATNKRDQPTQNIMKLLCLEQYFSDIYCIDSHSQVFATKSLMVRNLLKDWGLDVKDTVLIGDTAHDYQAAIDNTIRFIFAKYGYGGGESYDECILTIESVQNFFTQINYEKKPNL